MTVPLRVRFNELMPTKSPAQKLFPVCVDCTFFQLELMKPADGVPPIELTESPDRRAEAFDARMDKGRSIAAIHQPPAGSPWRWDQSPHIAAAVTVTIGRATDDDAGTAPAAVPSTVVPTVTAPGGGRSRRQRGRPQRCRGNCNKRESA
jgi:hypothetical protein